MIFSKYYCFFILVLSFSLFTSGNKITGRIIAGSDAPHGKYPYYAFLSAVKDQQPYQCGGVILAHRWILTATHCTEGHQPENIWVHAGFLESRQRKFQQRSPAVKKYEHPGYYRYGPIVSGPIGPTHTPNDICLLFLRTPFFFYSLVRPAVLPVSSKDKVRGLEPCDIVGFGDTEIGEGETYPDVLQEADTNIYPDAKCYKKLYWHFDPEIQVCILKPNSKNNACSGDSGGPLTCFDQKRNASVLRGVTSWGTLSCNISQDPTVYTRVSFYVDWIKDTIRYSSWVIGDCSVSCGEGTRLDKRTCTGDYCSDPDIILHRVSTCKMPACPSGEDVCSDLKCSPDAVCFPEKGYYQCKCLPEFVGDGRDCRYEIEDDFITEDGSLLCCKISLMYK